MDLFKPFKSLSSSDLRELAEHCESLESLTPFDWVFNAPQKELSAASLGWGYLTVYRSSFQGFDYTEEGIEKFKDKCWSAYMHHCESPIFKVAARGPNPLQAYIDVVEKYRSHEHYQEDITLVYSF